jgi:hypothetical protein
MIINFSKSAIQIPQLVINDSPIDRVDKFKLLIVTISNELKWSKHVESIVNMANQRLYILSSARKAWSSIKDNIH